jgi:hypothetical protein
VRLRGLFKWDWFLGLLGKRWIGLIARNVVENGNWQFLIFKARYFFPFESVETRCLTLELLNH